jgi:hypothetical protein
LPVLSQQPLGQLVALQTQAPFTQTWPLGQAEPVLPQTHATKVQVSALLPQARQAPPLVPHADVVLPATHVPLAQQPPLQRLVELHAEVQVPLLHAMSAGQSLAALQPQTPLDRHTWPAPLVAQLTQAAPPVPQVVVPEGWQLPLLSQQPLGQLVALHTQAPFTQARPLGQAALVVPQTQMPLLQVSPAGAQVRQATPLVPQANGSLVPATQVVPLQQPPLQGSLAPQAPLQT